MIKPDSLRAAIAVHNPSLARDPERLLMFVDRGNARSFMTPDESFETRYTLNIIITDFAADPSSLMIAILSWLRINQPDLLVPPNQAFQFEVDILDNGLVDLSLNLDLTEQVATIRRADGGFDMEYLPEPENLFDAGDDDYGLPIPPVPLTGAYIGETLLPFLIAPPPIRPGIFSIQSYDAALGGRGFGYATALNPEYTAADPLILAAGTRVQLPVAGPVLDELSGLFAGHDYLENGRFMPRRFNDVFDLRLTVTGRSALSGNIMKVEMDIGGAQGVIDGDEYSFPAGAGDSGRLIFKYMDFSRQTFLDNAAAFFAIAAKDCAVWDIQLLFLPRGAAFRAAL